MLDHAQQRAISFHRSQISSIELHRAVVRKLGAATEAVWSGLSQDVSTAVDRHRGGANQQVIDDLPVERGVWQVTADDRLPPGGGPLENRLLAGGEPAEC